MIIQRADFRDLDSLAVLFDAYRQFYRMAADLEGGRRFLRDRVERNESVIFIALEEGRAWGSRSFTPAFLQEQWRGFSF